MILTRKTGMAHRMDSSAADLSNRTKGFVAMAERVASGEMIGNLVTVLSAIDTPLGLIPMTRNDGRGPTCYICCPSVAYLDYAISELRHFSAPPLVKGMLRGLIGAMRPLVWASGLDRQVQPNNWLLATNPVPALDAADIRALTQDLVAAHPDHAIVWRSLNDGAGGAAIAAFRAAGYAMLPARQIYLFDCRTAQVPGHRDEKRDAALLGQPDYQVTGPAAIGGADIGRMADLYAKLYLDKYTPLNPRYSAEFLAEVHRTGLFELQGLRNAAGVLDGFVGFFDAGSVMTAPVVGYDTALPAELGLYRRLMAIALGRARQRQLLFNMSAGAASFKRNRGAVAALEHTAVFNTHLGRRQKLAGWLMRKILETIGIPVLRSFEQ